MQGYIYCLLLKANVIKVGVSKNPEKRFLAFRKAGVMETCISECCADRMEAEYRLIKSAQGICGGPIKGKEYFCGQFKHFTDISAQIRHIVANIGIVDDLPVKKDLSVTIRSLTDDQYDWLENKSKETGLSLSAIFKMWILDNIKRGK